MLYLYAYKYVRPIIFSGRMLFFSYIFSLPAVFCELSLGGELSTLFSGYLTLYQQWCSGCIRFLMSHNYLIWVNSGIPSFGRPRVRWGASMNGPHPPSSPPRLCVTLSLTSFSWLHASERLRMICWTELPHCRRGEKNAEALLRGFCFGVPVDSLASDQREYPAEILFIYLQRCWYSLSTPSPLLHSLDIMLGRLQNLCPCFGFSKVSKITYLL